MPLNRPPSPETIAIDLSYAIEDLSSRAVRADGTPSVTRYTPELCESYRGMAICILTREADIDRFFRFLLHSPLAKRRVLSTVGIDKNAKLDIKMASETGPLLDAIAARQWPLAADVAKLTHDAWVKNAEYEDDFCHGEFWRQFCLQPNANQTALLDRWTGVLGDGKDLRLDVAIAFNNKDRDAFVDALTALLENNEAEAAKLANPIGGSALSEDPTFAPNRWVSIEGLAWLAAADRAGMTIDEDFNGCPRIVRTDRYGAFQSYFYPNTGL